MLTSQELEPQAILAKMQDRNTKIGDQQKRHDKP